MRISIEGNVGSGKSTLMRSLSRWWTTYQEPVDEWQEILELFYADKQRWAFGMNVKALAAFDRVPPADEAGRAVLVERSPLSCKEVFARMHLNQGHLTSKEWELFCDLFDLAGWVPDVVIYLLSNPNLCMERVVTRGRKGEAVVDKEYLGRLQFAHTTMLKYFDGEVHVVDASQDSSAVFERVKDILQAYDVQIFSDQAVQ